MEKVSLERFPCSGREVKPLSWLPGLEHVGQQDSLGREPHNLGSVHLHLNPGSDARPVFDLNKSLYSVLLSYFLVV